MQEAELGRIVAPGQQSKKVHETPSQQKKGGYGGTSAIVGGLK
jgi:hypothetical protein